MVTYNKLKPKKYALMQLFTRSITMAILLICGKVWKSKESSMWLIYILFIPWMSLCILLMTSTKIEFFSNGGDWCAGIKWPIHGELGPVACQANNEGKWNQKCPKTGCTSRHAQLRKAAVALLFWLGFLLFYSYVICSYFSFSIILY